MYRDPIRVFTYDILGSNQTKHYGEEPLSFPAPYPLSPFCPSLLPPLSLSLPIPHHFLQADMMHSSGVH